MCEKGYGRNILLPEREMREENKCSLRIRELSLSIEGTQGKMDIINSILNLSIMFFKNNIFKKSKIKMFLL